MHEDTTMGIIPIGKPTSLSEGYKRVYKLKYLAIIKRTYSGEYGEEVDELSKEFDTIDDVLAYIKTNKNITLKYVYEYISKYNPKFVLTLEEEKGGISGDMF